MFSQAVRSWSRLGSWKTTPMRWRTSLRWRDGIEPVELERAARRLQQRGEHPDGRRLPRPVGPEEGEDLAAPDVERDVVDGGDVAELLDEMLDADDGRVVHEGTAGGGRSARRCERERRRNLEVGEPLRHSPRARCRSIIQVSPTARCDFPRPASAPSRDHLLHGLRAHRPDRRLVATLAALLALGSHRASRQDLQSEIAGVAPRSPSAIGEGTLVVMAAPEASISRNGYVPDQNYLYLTGLREPGGALLMRSTAASPKRSSSSPTRSRRPRCGRAVRLASRARAPRPG